MSPYKVIKQSECPRVHEHYKGMVSWLIGKGCVCGYDNQVRELYDLETAIKELILENSTLSEAIKNK
jgi:hypothetical protein